MLSYFQNVKRKNAKRVYAEVEDYYGKKLKKSEDVKIVNCSVKAGTACTKLIKEALSSVHPEVSSRSVNTLIISLWSFLNTYCFSLFIEYLQSSLPCTLHQLQDISLCVNPLLKHANMQFLEIHERCQDS